MSALGFVDQLSSSLFDQLGMSENQPGTLDQGGKSFGALGSFSKEIDRSAQRSYIETGVIRNIRPRALEVLMQEPDITVVIKKRMFSSLIENYRMDLMDNKEKLFVKASKKLFYNKCRAVSAYERLTKIKKISTEAGFINDTVFPMLFGVVDVLESSDLTKNWIDGKTQSVLETMYKVKSLSDTNNFTTWVLDKDLPYVTDTGEGTGTFELTMVSSFNSNTSVNLGQGSGKITVEDPYRLMIITNEDIDMAISQATNIFSQSNFTRITEYQLSKTIQELKDNLNQIRIARGVSRIRFHINEETLLYKKVRAIIDEDGREINFSFNAGTFGANLFSRDDDTIDIDPAAFEGINGLREDNNEVGLLKQILHNTYLLIGLKHSTNSEIKTFNEETNYVRKKMRLHFGNKPIIQPMDVVYIFVNTKTTLDSKIVQGLNFRYSNDSLLNQIDNTIGNVDSMLDDIRRGFGGSKPGEESFIESEKNAIAGPEFPMWLWTLMRNDFTRQAAGTCVFVGPVGDSTHSYREGRYTLDVNIKDNSHYLDMGQINIQPSSQVWNGPLYDPLTPFDLDFDDASGFVRGETPKLLDENIVLLNTGSIRSKLGRMRGKPLTNKKYVEVKDIEPMVYGDSKYGYRRLYHDPDGFVYRWKEGIGALTVYGSTFSNELGSFNNDTVPNLTKDPFAGQDVMNVLSLLVTGLPYNFNTYMSSAVKMGKLNRDDFFNKGNSKSFFKGLTNDISEKNSTWGNFIPFKKILINESGYNFILWNQSSMGLISLEADIQRLLKERAKVQDLLNQISSANSLDIKGNYAVGLDGRSAASSAVIEQGTYTKLQQRNTEITLQIKQKRDSFLQGMTSMKFARNPEGTLSIFGNDISFDTSITTDSGTPRESKRIIERSKFRKKINYLTLRRLWKVKGNEDSNLFIVDDLYDKNFDIQAFEQARIDVNLFNSTYKNIKDHVNEVRATLGLEVFADSQGHIQVRPPQYNRVPKSVFRDMLQKKAEKGIQLFPKYLERLFFNKIEGLTEQLEITEDQIRLRANALGYVTDNAIQSFLSKTGGGQFKFLTNEITGNLKGDLKNMFVQNDPELQEDHFKSTLKKTRSKLDWELTSNIIFSVVTQVDFLTGPIQKIASPVMQDRIKEISDRLKGRGIQNAPSSRSAILSSKFENSFKQINILKVTNEIAGLISDRYRLIKSFSNTLKNLTQGLSVNEENSKVAHSILLPNLHQQENDIEFPEMLEHMIEDENVDDFGEGAGKRYIIKDSNIISFSINEKGPEHTIVQVDGRLETGLVDFPTSANLQGPVGQANAVGSAFAVDYDMWRMYGWRKPNAVQAPFFSNPETQCAPFAVYLLNLARKKVFTAQATLVGNEFIQPGEVYYIEDRDLLFYSDSVSHSYTYDSSFTTTINMTFGHNPGEYIPTNLDVIGSALYSNKYRADKSKNVRHGRADDSAHVATLVADIPTAVAENTVEWTINKLLTGSYGEANRKALGNILMSAGNWWPPSTFGKKVKIEIRTYANTSPDMGIKFNTALETMANNIYSWILNPRKVSLDGEKVLEDDSRNPADNENPKLSKDDVIVDPIDLNSKLENTKSPSTEAWGMCKSILNSGYQAAPIQKMLEREETISKFEYQKGSSADISRSKKVQQILAKKLNQILVNQVIDIWVSFSKPDLTKESTVKKGLTETNSQGELLTQEQIDQALASLNDTIRNNPQS